MSTPIKIVIAGIGGVGGYFGGLLAKKYADSETVEIVFVARGEHLQAIQQKGLQVNKGDYNFIAKPHLATANPSDIGIVTYVIVCTKNYDLAEMIAQLAPCIDQQTIIVPLLNGIDGVEVIQSLLPHNLVTYGCAYIVSAIQAPGIVANMGNRQEIYFGLQNQSDERLVTLEKLLKDANIEATHSTNILKVIWEKFIFLSCIATATSYFNQTVGQLLEENNATLTAMIDEVTAIALKKGIDVSPEMKAKAMQHYKTLPYDATSSMHRDYLNFKPQTELNSLTGYVVRQAAQLNVETPIFNSTYTYLLNK